MTTTPTPTLVSAVALIAPDGRILMQRRRISAYHGGLWEFPGGKLEPGETPETALFREIGEELGIALDASQLEPVTFVTGAQSPDPGESRLVIFLYACRHWTGELRCLEGEEIAWFAPSKLAHLAMPPLDYPLAERLLAMLSASSG